MDDGSNGCVGGNVFTFRPSFFLYEFRDSAPSSLLNSTWIGSFPFNSAT